SLLEEDYFDVAKSFLAKADEMGVKVILPVDHLCAKKFSDEAEALLIDSVDIPDELIGMDIGPKTVALIVDAVKKAASVVWNGPMGVFEFDAFAKGTEAVAQAAAESSAT